MIDADLPAHVAHIGLLDVRELREKHNYDTGVAGFELGVAGKNGGVAGGGKTPPPASKTESSEGKDAA